VSGGSEGEGFLVSGLHYHGTSPAYFDWRPSGLSTAWVDIFRTANGRWNSATSSPVYCYRYDSSSNLVADVSLGGPDARVAWKPGGGFDIQVDTVRCSSYTTARKTGIAVHELGHTIGLNDLYDSNNTDQVMYYGSGSRATYPYSNIPGRHGDVYGATVIW
jgi:hypothetical protein